MPKTGGRNNQGFTTSRFRGGGAKRMYRLIDFKRRKDHVEANVEAIEYDPNRNCYIALLKYTDGELAYVLAAPYALPWYDALPWALLPLVAVSWRSWLLLAHTTVLSLAYLPGRDAVHLHGTLRMLTNGTRSVVAPLVIVVLVGAVLAVSRGSVSSPAGS